jgi:hypothetical protein
MNVSPTISPPIGLKALFRCVMALGPILGFRYWKLQRYCAAYPDLISTLVTQSRWQALEYELDGNTKGAAVLRDWADRLEEMERKVAKT